METKSQKEKILATCYSTICDEKEKQAEICFTELESILLSEIKNNNVKFSGLEGFLRTCYCRKCKK